MSCQKESPNIQLCSLFGKINIDDLKDVGELNKFDLIDKND